MMFLMDNPSVPYTCKGFPDREILTGIMSRLLAKPTVRLISEADAAGQLFKRLVASFTDCEKKTHEIKELLT